MAKERGEGLPDFEVQPGEVGQEQIHPEVVERPVDLPPTGEIMPPLPEVAPLPKQTESPINATGAEQTREGGFKTMPSPPEFPYKLEELMTWGDH